MGSFFNWESLKPVALAFYENSLFPAAQSFVQSTSNSYDDAALNLVDAFIRDFLKSA